jgi:hypothetical protein
MEMIKARMRLSIKGIRALSADDAPRVMVSRAAIINAGANWSFWELLYQGVIINANKRPLSI